MIGVSARGSRIRPGPEALCFLLFAADPVLCRRSSPRLDFEGFCSLMSPEEEERLDRRVREAEKLRVRSIDLTKC